MTFLELCKRVRQEAGTSGTGPASVSGQVGDLKRIVDWVSSSWEEIQTLRNDWRWMRGDFSFITSVGDGSYTAAQAGISTRFAHWHTDTFKWYLNSAGVATRTPLGHLPYRVWDLAYNTSGSASPGSPQAATVADDDQLLIGPTPDEEYVISGKYQKSPQVLTVDGDIPEMPERFHMAIVYSALMKYARYDAAAEIYGDAQINYSRIIGLLEQKYLPEIELAEPLI